MQIVRSAERVVIWYEAAAKPGFDELTSVPDSHGRWRYEHQRGDFGTDNDRHDWGFTPPTPPPLTPTPTNGATSGLCIMTRPGRKSGEAGSAMRCYTRAPTVRTGAGGFLRKTLRKGRCGGG
jgi:hypothetical protein